MDYEEMVIAEEPNTSVSVWLFGGKPLWNKTKQMSPCLFTIIILGPSDGQSLRKASTDWTGQITIAPNLPCEILKFR